MYQITFIAKHVLLNVIKNDSTDPDVNVNKKVGRMNY